MRGIIARSSNIGTVLLARQMDKHVLRDYLLSFGLGRKTGIELPGESGGIMPKADFEDRTRDQVAFGQALAVTGMQEAAALAGILNGGVYNPPTVIQGVTDAEGRTVPVDRQAPRRVVSAETSDQVRDLMVAVVDSENGQRGLKLDGYRSGGKTGTAQRADTTLRLLPRLRHLLRRVRPGGRPADPDLRRRHQPQGRRHGHRHGGPGGPRPDEHGAAALLGRSGRGPAQPQAHRMGVNPVDHDPVPPVTR